MKPGAIRCLPLSAVLIICVAGTPYCTIATAQPQPYPTKPIRLIVPYPAGDSADLIGRAVNERLAQRLG
jgi:tripartite-type tricarboxylate transporter receptor subunit TctC